MEKITVQVDPRLARFLRSRFGIAVLALSGVAITFAPFHLFQQGQRGLVLTNPWVLMNLGVIYGLGVLHLRVSWPVIQQLRKTAETHLFDG